MTVLTDRQRPLRIAQVAPPIERVPPSGYGGTERIVHELSRELHRRGHEVVLFASGDSDAPGDLVATVPEALRTSGYGGDPSGWFAATQLVVMRRAHEFDLIHSHMDFHGLVLARAVSRPVVSTFHTRLDLPSAQVAFADRPAGAVAISRAQAALHPSLPWAGIVHNGLTLTTMPFGEERGDSLCFVGRPVPEKGVLEAIEVARLAGRRLRMAIKDPWLPSERRFYDERLVPALGRADVEVLGELGPHDRDVLLATSFAMLMPGAWPEPFGLTAIESLAAGTPVICRAVGGLREIVRHGQDGFFADTPEAMAAALDGVAGLDRSRIRRSVLRRFSAERMADGYERVYARMLGTSGAGGRRRVVHEGRLIASVARG